MSKKGKRLSYTELSELGTFMERYEYLRLGGTVCDETFGGSRSLNQALYSSEEWRRVRDEVIIRDNGCDMGLEDRKVPEGCPVVVHHINPITKADILNRSPSLFDPDNLVCVSNFTHLMIHYGSADAMQSVEPVQRRPNDTCPWKEQQDGDDPRRCETRM